MSEQLEETAQAREIVKTFKAIAMELCRGELTINPQISESRLILDVFCHSAEDTAVMIGKNGSTKIATQKILDAKSKTIRFDKRIDLWIKGNKKEYSTQETEVYQEVAQ